MYAKTCFDKSIKDIDVEYFQDTDDVGDGLLGVTTRDDYIELCCTAEEALDFAEKLNCLLRSI